MPNTRTNAPRGALVFDMRQLGRQAGSALSRSRTVPAPADLHLELVSVPVGAEVALDVRFEAVTEGVLATGTATAPLAGECARCLDPLTSTVTVSFQELYLYSEGRRTDLVRSPTSGKSTTSEPSTIGMTRTRSATMRSAISTVTCST